MSDAATAREQLDLFTAAADEPDAPSDQPRSSQLTELPGTEFEHIFQDAA